MRKLVWIIQDGLTDSDSQRLTEACNRLGNKVIKLNYEMSTLYNVFPEDKVMFYGTVPLASELLSIGKWKPCVVKNDNLDYEVWSKQWGQDCLNSNSDICTIDELANDFPSGKCFIRPCLDDKLFTGKVFSYSEFSELAFVFSQICPEKLTSKVAVSPSKAIIEEWRIFLVDKKVVTGSLYQKDGKSEQTNVIPEDIVKFCETAAQKWSPADVFTLDIARHEGKLLIIETGCFNHAGLYSSDVLKLVEAINKHYESSCT